MIVLNTQIEDEKQCYACRNMAKYKLHFGILGNQSTNVYLCKECFEDIFKLMKGEVRYDT